jgi:hypothetical protein
VSVLAFSLPKWSMAYLELPPSFAKSMALVSVLPDGGGGVDTLKLDGAGLTLDLTKISNTRIQDIEIILELPPSFAKSMALVSVLPKMT